jgi:hypothetical protein
MKAEAPSPSPPHTNSAALSLDGLHRMQCHAAERHSSGAISEAVSAWGSILRLLLPHILGTTTPTTTSTSGRGCGGVNNNIGFVDRAGPIPGHPDPPLVLWVAPVPHVSRSDDAIFALFPYVLVYTKAGDGGEKDAGGHGSSSSSSSSDDDHHPRLRHCLQSPGPELRRMGAGAAYNLGLAYHMQALQGSSSPCVCPPASSLRTALRAYKAARDMLLSVGGGGSSSSSLLLSSSSSSSSFPPRQPSVARQLQLLEDDRLLLLAIANNEGMIHELLHERDGVAVALQCLRRGLVGAQNPAGICRHFAFTDALYGDPHAHQFLHSAAA